MRSINSHKLKQAGRIVAGLVALVVWLGVGIARAEEPWDSYAAVYELDQWSLDWSPVHGLRVEAHRIVRVNRSSGADVGRIRIWDTFFQRLRGFEGEVRDTNGNVIFKVGKDDVRPIAPFTEFRLFSGDVVRAIDLVAPQPPYIIEARWTVEIDNPFFWPDWVISDNYPRRHAVYEVAIPKDRSIRYQQAHPALTQEADRRPRRKVMVWELHDWMPPDQDGTVGAVHTPLLHVAPLEFRVGRHKGRTDTWDALGRWYWSLTSGRIKLKKDQIAAVEDRLSDYVGARAQASALKDWISDNWRYVAIEVGIGGWRPHHARDVFVNRYGDCKDVVFLWVAMMRQMGLNAYPALIRARDPSPIDPEFPKDWFDHVVGVAVINGDTLWADLSDARYPLGTLPRRCESRWALMVGEFGGKLLQTPARTAYDNWLVTRTDGVLTPEGDLEFSTRVLASGHFARRLPLRGELDHAVAPAVILGIAPTAVEGTAERFEAVAPDSIEAHLSGTIRGWALTSRKQIQLRPRIGGWVNADSLAGRPDPGAVEFPEMVFDTLAIRFPPGWAPDFWPAAAFHSEEQGEMGEVSSFVDGTLTIVRRLSWHALDRSEETRQAAGRLRRAFRKAQDAEWLFHPLPVDSPSVDRPSETAPDDSTTGALQPGESPPVDTSSGPPGF
jgi:hypothetical protein